MTNDPVALKHIAAEVRDLQDTLKVGLVNGDLYVTRPDHLTKAQANAHNNKTFSEYEQYRAAHAEQLTTLRSMSDVESEWFAITRSWPGDGHDPAAVRQRANDASWTCRRERRWRWR